MIHGAEQTLKTDDERGEASCPYHLGQALNSYMSNDNSGHLCPIVQRLFLSERHVPLLSAWLCLRVPVTESRSSPVLEAVKQILKCVSISSTNRFKTHLPVSPDVTLEALYEVRTEGGFFSNRSAKNSPDLG